jgi:hypothetical protein
MTYFRDSLKIIVLIVIGLLIGSGIGLLLLGEHLFTPSLGTVSVSSYPSGAEVSVDGLYTGTTPITLTNVTPGIHTFRLSKSGYIELVVSEEVRSGETSEVFGDLVQTEV